MRDQALDTAEALGQGAKAHAIHERARRRKRTQIKGDHRAKPTLLALGQLVLRMRDKPRIEHPPYFRMPLQKLSDGSAVQLMPLHAHSQGLDSTRSEKAVQRGQACSGSALHEVNLVGVILACHNNGPADTVAVTVEILSERMHDDVGAQRDWLLQVRTQKSIVDDEG